MCWTIYWKTSLLKSHWNISAYISVIFQNTLQENQFPHALVFTIKHFLNFQWTNCKSYTHKWVNFVKGYFLWKFCSTPKSQLFAKWLSCAMMRITRPKITTDWPTKGFATGGYGNRKICKNALKIQPRRRFVKS